MNRTLKHLPLILVGIISVALIASIELKRVNDDSRFVLACVGYAVFLLILPLIIFIGKFKNNKKLAQIVSILQLLIAFGLLIVHKDYAFVAPILLVMWTAILPEIFSWRGVWVLVSISVVAFFIITGYVWHNSPPFFMILLYVAFQLFSLFVTAAKVSERQAREHLEQVNQQLQATRILLAQSSREEERLRIARDLHDILGHQLTALSLQLEILSHKVPEMLQNDVQQSKLLAKDVLENIRLVVRNQRRLSSLDICQAVRAMVSRMPNVAVDIAGELNLHSVAVAEQLVLCIQEGVSNAVRHGFADHVELVLKQQNSEIEIQLIDNGRGLINATSVSQNQGTGLQGMRERVSSFAGRVELKQLTQGCCLTIKVNADVFEVSDDKNSASG